MKDYIEREQAITVFKTFYGKSLRVVLDALREEHAADVREVVLCRDCKHRFMTPNGWHCHYAEWAIEDDDFCSCGEKREES